MTTVAYFDSPPTDEQRRMAEDHFPLAVKAAYYNRGHMRHEDAVDCAVDGLLRSAHRYDPSRGAKASTWVVGNVRWALWERAKWYARHPQPGSLDEPNPDLQDGVTYMESLEYRGPGPVDHALYGEFEDAVRAAREGLPERQRRVLELYQDDGLTLAEIARLLGVCEARVFQLRRQALASLRETLEGGGWI